MDDEREPLFNAPWTAVVIALSIVLSYAVQGWGVNPGVLVYRSGDVAAGRWWAPFTVVLVHGGWAHALMNAVGAVAFGAPAARFLGLGTRGALAFGELYLACAGLSTLGYGFLHMGDGAALAGASGGVSGLFGAAARLTVGGGVPGRLISRPLIGMSAAWILGNLLVGLIGLWPGAEGMAIAWEAHVLGYVAGVLLVGVFGRIAGRAF